MLIPSVSPAPCIAAFTTQLPAFLWGAPGLVKQVYLGGDPPIPTPSAVGTGAPVAQQVFQLSLNAAATNTATINPPSVGWRFFAGSLPSTEVSTPSSDVSPRSTDGSSPGTDASLLSAEVPARVTSASSPGNIVLGRVVQIPPSTAWKLTGVFYGERVVQALSASDKLGKLPQVAAADYQARLLAIPGLNLEAFWLVPRKAGSADLIVPFPAGQEQLIPALRSSNPYNLTTFLGLIRPLAGSLLTMPAAHGA